MLLSTSNTQTSIMAEPISYGENYIVAAEDKLLTSLRSSSMSGKREMLYKNNHVPQLLEIAYSLAQNQEIDNRVAILSSYDDTIHNRFRELKDLFIEAKVIQDSTRTIPNEIPIVISGYAEPCYINDVFLVGFVREEYLELMDFVIDFIGLPENMLKPMIWGVFSLDPIIGQDVDSNIYDKVFELEGYESSPLNARISKGTHLSFWNPNTNLVKTMGSLGHPNNFEGIYINNYGSLVVLTVLDENENDFTYLARCLVFMIISLNPMLMLDLN